MLQEIWQSWVAVSTRPELPTFEQERLKATMDKALLATVIAGLVTGLLGAIRIIGGMALLSTISVPGRFDKELGEIPGFSLAPALPIISAFATGWAVLIAPISAVIGLLMFSGIIYIRYPVKTGFQSKKNVALLN